MNMEIIPKRKRKRNPQRKREGNNIPTFAVVCHTIEKINLFKDILEKIKTDSPKYFNNEDAITQIFDFFIKNYTSSRRTLELRKRSKREYRKKIEKEIIIDLTEKIRKQEISNLEDVLFEICDKDKDYLLSQIKTLKKENDRLKVKLKLECKSLIKLIKLWSN